MGANVSVRLEIEAEIPGGAPDQVVRIVTEIRRALKFNSHGFKEEGRRAIVGSPKSAVTGRKPLS